MTRKPTCLIDQSAAKVAALNVQLRDDHYEGTISLEGTPLALRELFERFEEIVEGQTFSLLDEIDEKIGTLPLRVCFDDGVEEHFADLQVFPSTNSVSFKIRQLAAVR